MITRRQILSRATAGALGTAFSLPFAARTAVADATGASARIEVLPGWRMPSGRHIAALSITLAPGWKTYWRAPGDAGIPAQFDWSGSSNLADVAVHWPVPQVFDQNGMTTVGYHDYLVLPVELTPRSPDRPILLSASIDMGVCRDICVPVTMAFAGTLPAAAARQDARISAALADRPMTRSEAGVRAVECAVAPAARGLNVTATVTMPDLGGQEFAVIELPGAPAWVSEARVRRTGATLTASVDIVPERGNALALNRSDLRITVLGRTGAVDIRGCR